ncbi:Hypothetical predicted protein [Olea europaea subsp. europaea]|uniref:Transmembrane protein n=1 Tax=Olea europaea subsp. europaea TaxID=158383 RepID=A0A8S0SS02_OLEEU|nr:Hypothetical predicted protein [Olea europaea subsp. europaea]
MVFCVVLCGGGGGVDVVAMLGGVYVVVVFGLGVCDDFIGGLKVVVNVVVVVLFEAALK